MNKFLIVAVAIILSVALAGHAQADGAVHASKRSRWSVGKSVDEEGRPGINTWRQAALDEPNRPQYRWRVGISWPFPHALESGMPSPPERVSMGEIDAAIHGLFERDGEHRIVFMRTGGGIREVMLYAKSEAEAWKRVEALIKKFPAAFPGDKKAHAYVKEDADWSEYRAILAAVKP